MSRHCVMVGLMGVGKSTVGAALATRLGWAFRDSDADIQAATGLTSGSCATRTASTRCTSSRPGTCSGAGRVEPSVIAAAASVADVAACLVALRAPDVFVVWLQASPECLADRFDSSDDHRPAYGDSTEAFLARQLAAAGAALRPWRPAVDIAERTPGELTDVVLEALR